MDLSDGPNSELIDAVYAAASEPSEWSEVLPLLRERYNSIASSFTMQRYNDGDVTLGLNEGYTDQYLNSYLDTFGRHNPFVTRGSGFEIGATLTDSIYDDSRYAADRFEQTFFYNEWARPQRFRHALGSALELQGSHIQIFAMWRDMAAGAFTAAQVAEITVLSQHLRRAAILTQRLKTIRESVAVSTALRGTIRCGVVSLNRHGKIKSLDEEAARVLRSGQCLTSFNGRLSSQNAGNGDRLHQIIQLAMSSRTVGGGEYGPILLYRPDGHVALAVKAIRLPTQIHPFADSGTTVAVVLVKDLEMEAVSLAKATSEFAKLYRLTPSEMKLLRALHHAQNLRDATVLNGANYETSRSRLKSIYAKTGTSSQIELIRAVSRLAF